MISNNNNSGKVQINGKTYQTVAYRLASFRKKYPMESGWSIDTECIECNQERVIFKATIKNPEGKVLSTGHAEEMRDSSRVNRTSALENAETSAIGRALAAAGFIGSEFASADEVITAVETQNKIEKKNSNKIENKPSEAKKNQQKATNEKEKKEREEREERNIISLPDISKAGWEKSEVPKQLLPCAERWKSVKWIELILDTIKLKGKKRILTGAQYLHAVENWKHPFVQRPEVQAVIKAALVMRERIKEVISAPVQIAG